MEITRRPWLCFFGFSGDRVPLRVPLRAVKVSKKSMIRGLMQGPEELVRLLMMMIIYIYTYYIILYIIYMYVYVMQHYSLGLLVTSIA